VSLLSPDDARCLAELRGLVDHILHDLDPSPIVGAIQRAIDSDASSVMESPAALLPVWVCLSAGGQSRRALPVSAAWCLLHIAALMLDDVQDEEFDRTTWPEMTPSQAVNVATALTFVSQLALEHLCQMETEADLVLALWGNFSRAVVRVCSGQHLDLVGSAPTLDDYWRAAAGKSGEVFALACRAGAMVATRESRLIDRYARFGYNLGILIQIGDDFEGLWHASGPGDLVNGARSLPVVYAFSVASPEMRTRLSSLLARLPGETEVANEARQMILDLGALHYMVAQAELFRSRAESVLPAPVKRGGPAHDSLVSLLERSMPILRQPTI
jgi:geranylgeranyl pyrophosphate synthase